jgi:hypothetical protein
MSPEAIKAEVQTLPLEILEQFDEHLIWNYQGFEILAEAVQDPQSSAVLQQFKKAIAEFEAVLTPMHEETNRRMQQIIQERESNHV